MQTQRHVAIEPLEWRTGAKAMDRATTSRQGRKRPASRAALVAGLILVVLGAATSATASRVDRCLAVSEERAVVERVALAANEVRLTFVGHATFLIESPGGVTIATDYNDFVRPAVVPDIVTMNRAHNTHFTDHPEATIRHVLRGWNPKGGEAQHDLELADVRVRNVPTNIRDWGGGTELGANSIFIFEVAGLCIAHLGHLHHTLTSGHFSRLGQIDVALVPVDGSYTLDLPGMVEVLKGLHAPLMIPMHYFSETGLNRFLDRVRQDFEVRQHPSPTIVLKRSTLPQPASPQVLVLPGR
jgi:L-ascorbate metabolism protein UlaG (beta-lactamase superfamily)